MRDERGSFTIESVFVFPIVLSIILLFIMLGMYLYQKNLLYYSASATSERAAFGWDNSNRDPVSGILLKPEYDGLYRNLGDDGVLGSLFGLLGDHSKDSTAINLPVGEAGVDSEGNNAASKNANGSPEQKLERAAGWMKQAGISNVGQASFTNKLMTDFVTVRLNQGMRMLPWQSDSATQLTSESLVVDPVAFIRSVDLMRYYTDRLLHSPAGKKEAAENAGKILSSYEAKKVK